MIRSAWRAVGPLAEVMETLRRSPATPSGGIYVIEFDSGVAKIGCSGEPAKRIANIARGVEIYGGWKAIRVAVSDGCTNFYEVESALHRHFANANVEGEIFRVSIEDVAPVLAAIDLRDDTAIHKANSEKLVNGFKAFWAQNREHHDDADVDYSEFGEAADVIREDDELLEHMSDLCLNMTVYSRVIALSIADAMDSEPSFDEKCAILGRIAKVFSDAILSELGPESAIVVLEKADGRRELAMVQDPLNVVDGDTRGRIVTVIKSNPAKSG